MPPSVHARLLRAGQKVRAAIFERDQVIVEASQHGLSLRTIAEAVQLSHESVRRIIAKEEGEQDAS